MSYPGASVTDESSSVARSYDRERDAKEEITMTGTTSTVLTAARAEALFTSQLPTGSRPSLALLETAIRVAVRAHGVRGCAGRVATEYGDHPELAMPRMRWARDVVEQVYLAHRSRPVRPTGGWALVA
ncbi:hypothetical protein Voc01_080030 [Virgisporangium ochraceum]|uniref:Uncharacterized protein n=2 Tax=Virgisporangium ochraceum TaxID=65505 RepID=A0A8J4A5D8_9ACTN|nr:hypothetical protein Voc01_080030 [Virgisporangium ochraceum]